MAGTKGDVRGLSRVLHVIDWATSQASCVAGVVVVVGAALVWVIANRASRLRARRPSLRSRARSPSSWCS